MSLEDDERNDNFEEDDNNINPSVMMSAATGVFEEEEEDDNDEDTLKIFIATDNHLGYNEKDPIRGSDSFRTFEEILQMTKAENSDMLLLGGDLYHDNKPSRATMYRSMNLLRRYTSGDGPINFRVVSDQSVNFPNYGIVNYENPNVNVELPIFTIHGNHDDPIREGFTKALTSLDLLSVSNLINYFGASEQVEDINVYPVLLIKGNTKVAIYGLGHMRDERLNRMFAAKKVKFHRPAESTSDWFNIFVVHQNRNNRGRGSKNCVHESFIPEFIDFVLWGHEHECLVELTQSVKGKCFITQPGSSVATSLMEGEAREKHVGLLEIRRQDFRWQPKKLQTVRPFIVEEITLAKDSSLDVNDPKISEKIDKVLSARVNEILESNTNEDDDDDDLLMLLRLRVEHTGFPVINNQRFGSKFVGRLANPNNILVFHKTKISNRSSTRSSNKSRQDLKDLMSSNNDDKGICLEDMIATCLESSDQKLCLLPEKNLEEALENFVYKSMSNAIGDMVSTQLEEKQGILKTPGPGEAIQTSEQIKQVVEKSTEKIRQQSNASVSKSPSNRQQKRKEDLINHIADTGNIVHDEMQDLSCDDEFTSHATASRKPTNKRKAIDSEDDSDCNRRHLRRPSAKRTTRAVKENSLPSRTTSTTSRHRKPTKRISEEEIDDDESDLDPTQVKNSTKSSSWTCSQRKRKLPLTMQKMSCEEEESSNCVSGSALMQSWGRKK